MGQVTEEICLASKVEPWRHVRLIAKQPCYEADLVPGEKVMGLAGVATGLATLWSKYEFP